MADVMDPFEIHCTGRFRGVPPDIIGKPGDDILDTCPVLPGDRHIMGSEFLPADGRALGCHRSGDLKASHDRVF